MTHSLRKIITITLCILLGTVFAVTAYGMSFSAEAAAESVVYYGDESASLLSSSSTTETINYASKSEDSYTINAYFPNFYNTDNSLTNACANVAGANVIGFYDRYYDELIPGSTAGMAMGSTYVYYPMGVNSSEKQSVINALYVSMGTNTIESGTSQNQFHTGFTSYVTGKGRSVIYTSAVSGGTLNWESATSYIDNDKPVMLYLTGYNFANRTQNSGSDVYSKELYTGSHMAVAYGYNKVSYYNASGALIKTVMYFKIATGQNRGYSLYIVGNNGSLDDAESINIY